MGAASFIARHPWLVIAAWIVIVMVAAPLFAQLHRVVRTIQYSLPNGTEAQVAQHLLKRVSGASSSPGIVIVAGVNLGDNETLLKLVEWGRLYNETFTAKHLGSNLVSVPTLLASINETLYSAMLKAVNASALGARESYRGLIRLNETFALASENITRMVRELRNATTGLARADEGYSEAFRGLLALRNATIRVAHGLVEIDVSARNATDRLLLLVERVREAARGISKLDAYAHLMARNLTTSARVLLSVLSNRTLDSIVEEGLALEWWQVSRAYRYLEAFRGNYTMYVMYTNLSRIDPRLSPLPEDEALAAWRAVKSLVEKGVAADNAVLVIATRFYNATVSRRDPRLALILPVYVNAFNESLVAAKKALNITSITMMYSLDPRLAAKTQLEALNITRQAALKAAAWIANNSRIITVELLSKMLAEKGLGGELAKRLAVEAANGSLEPLDVYRAVVVLAASRMPELRGSEEVLARILAGYDPGIDARLARNYTLAVEAAKLLVAERMKSMGYQLPGWVLDEIARLVAMNETSRASIARVAYRLVEKMVREKSPEAAQLVQLVEKLDPEATGTLAGDKKLLASVVLSILRSRGGEKLSMIPSNVLEWLVERVVEGKPPSDEELRAKALDLVARRAAEMMGSRMAEKVEKLLEEYDPEASGLLARNKTAAALAIATMAVREASKSGFNISQDILVTLLLHPEKEHEVICRLFREETLKRTPREALWLVEKALDTLCERGVLDEAAVWSLVREALARGVKERAAKLPAWAQALLVEEALRVARNETSLAEAAKLLSEKLLLGEVAPRIINESRGLLVARDLKGFIVMFKPSGGSREERVESLREAARLANETLREMGFAVSVYATGQDAILQQVREYAIHDTEKTSKISEAATFIVLLAILESLFAVLLPYIGIGLGVVLGGALVFLGAKLGILEVTNEAQALMITTALGLGADYAGYLVHRFREEVALGHNSRRAVEVALRTAGPAIVASALTVIIGFASLLLGWDIAFLRSLGEVIPVAVAATALASLTLVPALLAIVGEKRWFWWPRRPSPERHVGKVSKLAERLVKHHWLVVAAMILLFIVAGYFYVNFHGSHDMTLMLPSSASSVKALEVLKNEYMPGITDPVFIVVRLPHSIYKDKALQEAVARLADRVASIKGVERVVKPNVTSGTLISKDGRIAAIQVVLGVYPYNAEGEKIVREVHRVAHEEAGASGLEVYVGGAPYAVLEMDELLHERFYYRILPAAALLMTIVFTVIFGALPASIASLAVIIGAAMAGIMVGVLLFQVLLGKPIVWFLHIVVLVAVMGVGMDYNSFFLARALEECQRTGCDPERAIPRAVGAVSLFILGLSLVVSSAYLSLLASSNTGMQEMGFILGVTILLAGVMASYLFTPLVIAMLGRGAWWPWGLKKRIAH